MSERGWELGGRERGRESGIRRRDTWNDVIGGMVGMFGVLWIWFYFLEREQWEDFYWILGLGWAVVAHQASLEPIHYYILKRSFLMS